MSWALKPERVGRFRKLAGSEFQTGWSNDFERTVANRQNKIAPTSPEKRGIF